MAYDGIRRLNRGLLEDLPQERRRTLSTTFKDSDGTVTELLKDIHFLVVSNQYILTILSTRVQTLSDRLEQIDNRLEKLESKQVEKNPELDELSKKFSNLKVSNQKIDDLKKAVDNISVASGSTPPQPKFDWRDKEITDWIEYLKNPKKLPK